MPSENLLTRVKQCDTLPHLERGLITLLSNSAVPQPVTRVVRATRPLLRVSRPLEGQYIWLRKGKEGSLQTAVEMAKLVRHDAATDEGLERFAVQKLIDARLDSHSLPEDIIDTIFRFVQSVPYIYDPAGSFDSVQSARHTLDKGYGDCDDLSVLLATLLALVGYKPRFVLAKYKDKTQGFDHVYVDLIVSDKQSIRRIALDPCSRSHGMGWESPSAIERLTFPIFSGKVSSVLGAFAGASSLALTGAQVGVSFIPVVGPFLSALVGPIAGLFSRTAQRSEEAARDAWKAQVHDGMLKIQQAVDSCQLSADQGKAAARELVERYYQACDQNFTKSSVAKSCRNAETEPGGFAERISRIAAGGASCAAGTGGVSSMLSTAGGGVNWPMILIIGGAVYFLFLKGR